MNSLRPLDVFVIALYMLAVLGIGPDDAGQRVDRFLRKVLPRATLSLVFKLLRTRQVVVNGRRARPEDRLVEGDEVTLFLGRRLADLRGPAAAEGAGGRRPRRKAGRLPPLRAAVMSIAPGDTLVFATDGIRAGFLAGLKLTDQPQPLADHILADHAKRTDDGLVLVARYRRE